MRRPCIPLTKRAGTHGSLAHIYEICFFTENKQVKPVFTLTHSIKYSPLPCPQFVFYRQRKPINVRRPCIHLAKKVAHTAHLVHTTSKWLGKSEQTQKLPATYKYPLLPSPVVHSSCITLGKSVAHMAQMAHKLANKWREVEGKTLTCELSYFVSSRYRSSCLVLQGR